ncbi:MAG: reverse transcriptase domain-containing protein, partial [Sedimenticola sp.]
MGKLFAVDEDTVIPFDDNDTSTCTQGDVVTDHFVASATAEAAESDEDLIKIAKDLGISLDDSDLSPDQKQSLLTFIGKNRDVFAKDTSELGCTNLHHHRIETGDAAPQRQRFYRTSPQVNDEIGKHIDDMLQNEIIEPSDSVWTSPVVMIKKKDNSFRFCIDYRRLNNVTVPINFPLPRLECIFDTIGNANAKVFTVLDLKSGFHQIPLDDETKHKTAFISRHGTFQFRRLSFGLMNAPMSFQMVMSKVLQGLNWKCALVYIDDILLFSANFTEHLDLLGNVFDRLRQANLKLHPLKCQFATRKVEYLGHILSRDGVEVNPSKIQVVKEYPAPKTAKQVRQFLGLTNYYRRFVKDYSKITSPLNKLLRKDIKFDWSPECETSFNILKDRLISPPILGFPDMQKEFILSTDASGTAIGYVLGQVAEDGTERVISYGGRSLRGTEFNWSVSERECLALVEAVKTYHPYLAHNHFTVYTDNIALQWLKKIKDETGRLARWSLKLQGYNFTIIHKAGVTNQNADALSRRPYPVDSVSSVVDTQCVNAASDMVDTKSHTYYQVELEYSHQQDTSPIPIISAAEELTEPDDSDPSKIPDIDSHNREDLGKLQWNCPDFKRILEYMVHSRLPDDNILSNRVVAESAQYVILDGILYHIFSVRSRGVPREARQIRQVAVPRVLREDVILSFHDCQAGGGHRGFDKTYASIRFRYFWPNSYRDIYSHVQSCEKCQTSKRQYGSHKAPLTPMPISEPLSRLHIDILGPLTTTPDKFKYVLLIVDSFTSWCEAFPLVTQEATEIARVLYSEIFTRYGCPRVLVSDRGKNFMSKLVSALCELFQVTRHNTSSYHPQTNSTVERVNSSLLQSLRTYCDKEHTNWPKLLPGIMMAFRMTVSATTEYSPYYMLFGREMRAPIDTSLIPKDTLGKSAKEHLDQLQVTLNITNEIAAKRRREAQARQKARYDRSAAEPSFKVGQRVLLRQEQSPVGMSKKLCPKYSEPLAIVEKG